MQNRRSILAIVGSASPRSSNERLVHLVARHGGYDFDFLFAPDLKLLPHFDPERSDVNPPQEVVDLRNSIQHAEGVLICTPEYIFSIPSGLKNLLEWCVATTVFSDKPVAVITASADGKCGHDELVLILKTLNARVKPEASWLVSGIRGKLNDHGELMDSRTQGEFAKFMVAFKELVAGVRGEQGESKEVTQ